MDGFKIFPVDIWRLLMSDYCDFKTKQNLSSCNKRLRGFFTDYQLRERKKWGFNFEDRIYDVEFKKLYICSNTLCELNRQMVKYDYGKISYKFCYLLYINDNCISNINIGLKSYIDDDLLKDTELITGQVYCETIGVALNALINNNFDIVFAIQSFL